MILLRHHRHEHVVPAGLAGPKLRARNLQLLQLKRRLTVLTSENFNREYWKPAKKPLRSETYGKCAYCEAPTTVVAYGDVEHFRPKSIYWWLVYCYDNYLYTCQICNQLFKQGHFPIRGVRMTGPDVRRDTPDERLEELKASLCPDPINIGQGYSLANFEWDGASERPYLLDPYQVDPEPLLAWEADTVLKEVALVPREGVAGSKTLVEHLEKYCGLNREELRRDRWYTYRELDGLHEDLQAPDLMPNRIVRKRGRIREMMSAKEPYAGMVRYFVTVVWNLDIAL